jgi:hypothetical protein
MGPEKEKGLPTEAPSNSTQPIDSTSVSDGTCGVPDALLEEFKQAIHAALGFAPAKIVADAQWHAFPPPDKPGSDAPRYWLDLAHPVEGRFGRWDVENGGGPKWVRWHPKGQVLTPTDHALLADKHAKQEAALKAILFR